MTQQHPAGWYPQPDGSRRYWDGSQWTGHTAPPSTTPPTSTQGTFVTPPAGVNPTQQARPDDRPLWKKKRVIIPAAALAAIVGISALNGGNNGSQSAVPGAASSTQPSDQPTPQEPSPTQAPEAPAAELFTMPDVIGMNLQDAQDQLQALGSYLMDQEDASGKGRIQINDSNWKVCSQQPLAGEQVPTSTTVVLSSVKTDESCPGQAAEAPDSDDPKEPEVQNLGNGDHIVGVDIKPGIYRAEVETGFFELCTVSQTDAKGTIMEIRNSNEGSVIFTVVKKKDSVVNFSGCDLIAPAKDVLRKNPEAITNGDWLVGSELKPGKYQGIVDQDSAIKLGTIYQTNAKGKVMDLRNANSGKVVFTVKKSKDSVVSFSGFSEIEKIG